MHPFLFGIYKYTPVFHNHKENSCFSCILKYISPWSKWILAEMTKKKKLPHILFHETTKEKKSNKKVLVSKNTSNFYRKKSKNYLFIPLNGKNPFSLLKMVKKKNYILILLNVERSLPLDLTPLYFLSFNLTIHLALL